MVIEIAKVNIKAYRADILDLPGSPRIGEGKSPEEAVALVFLNNMHNLRKHIEVNDSMFYSLTIKRTSEI